MTTARAFSNIAFIKYWGNRHQDLRLPVNPSLSMNLDGLFTETTITWSESSTEHSLTLNSNKIEQGNSALIRASNYLDTLKQRHKIAGYAAVTSENNFPTGAGIASSASAFAALALAATRAANIELSEAELSTVARLGSGSASRSIPGGFVEWQMGENHESSYAFSIAEPDHWDLVDMIAILSTEHKAVGSTQGHALADSSVLQNARIESSIDRLKTCRQALLDKNFDTFAEVVELDSNIMHAVMMTSSPPLFYWQPESVRVMQLVREWRQDGLSVCYTLDAGPNVHCICLSKDADKVYELLKNTAGVSQVLRATPGAAAHIVNA